MLDSSEHGASAPLQQHGTMAAANTITPSSDNDRALVQTKPGAQLADMNVLDGFMPFQ
jgi:hypothetical protein